MCRHAMLLALRTEGGDPIPVSFTSGWLPHSSSAARCSLLLTGRAARYMRVRWWSCASADFPCRQSSAIALLIEWTKAANARPTGRVEVCDANIACAATDLINVGLAGSIALSQMAHIHTLCDRGTVTVAATVWRYAVTHRRPRSRVRYCNVERTVHDS